MEEVPQFCITKIVWQDVKFSPCLWLCDCPPPLVKLHKWPTSAQLQDDVDKMLVLKEAEQLDDVQIGQGLVERDFLSHFVTLMRFLKTGTPGVVTNAIFYFYPLCTRNKTWFFFSPGAAVVNFVVKNPFRGLSRKIVKSDHTCRRVLATILPATTSPLFMSFSS